jgi:hypothetical protein
MKQLPALVAILMLLAGLFWPVAPVQGANFTCAAVIEIPQAECEALVALYRGTNGDS